MSDPIEVSTAWSGQKVRVVATRAGTVLHVDACDPGSAVARKRLLNGLVGVLSSVDVAAVERALTEMAVDGAPAAASPASSLVPADPEKWPAPVDGAELVRDIEARLRRYVILPEHGGIACALWELHTFCFKEFAYSPRLFFTSGTKRSGKSLAASLVASMCSRPLTADNISAAAVYRVVEAASPTMACDEVDTWLVPKSGATEASEALRGVCNSGFARDGCVIRCAGDNSDPKRYSTFGPMILAGIGQLPDTLADRSITLRMMRRGDSEKVERRPVGTTAREQNEDLVRRACRWVADSLPAIRETLPMMPDGIVSDRARDVWFPLLALAEVAGGDIAQRARAAAVALTASVDDSEDTRTRLLSDLRDAFGDSSSMTTASLLTALHGIVDAPWSHWSAGRPMTGHALGRTLASFGVVPERLRVNGTLVRGYTRTSLANAWTRYLSPRDGEAEGFQEASQASQPSQPAQTAGEIPVDVTLVTDVTVPGRGSALSAAAEEVAMLIGELADELTDPRVQAAAGYGPDDLRAHYRAFYGAFGPDATLAAVQWRREGMVLGHLFPLVLPESMAGASA